jgi:tight adherence protein C
MLEVPVLLALIFAALFTLFLVLGLYMTDRSRLRRFNQDVLAGKVTATDQELALPFSERVIKPFMTLLSRIARRVSPSGFVAGIRRRLALAGNPRALNVDKFLALKALCSLLVLAITLASGLLQASLTFRALLGGSLLTLVAFFLPDLWLQGKIRDRQKAIRIALPDTLDLLTISVEAGLGFDSALSKVASNTSGPLAGEFFRMLQEIQLGTPRSQAFRNLGERTDVSELNSFIMAMLQADIFGISVGKVLRVQAQEMRIKRRQQAEEIAMKAPVKIVFPLVLCIFPALLVVVLGPAAINIYHAIAGGL